MDIFSGQRFVCLGHVSGSRTMGQELATPNALRIGGPATRENVVSDAELVPTRVKQIWSSGDMA